MYASGHSLSCIYSAYNIGPLYKSLCSSWIASRALIFSTAIIQRLLSDPHQDPVEKWGFPERRKPRRLNNLANNPNELQDLRSFPRKCRSLCRRAPSYGEDAQCRCEPDTPGPATVVLLTALKLPWSREPHLPSPPPRSRRSPDASNTAHRLPFEMKPVLFRWPARGRERAPTERRMSCVLCLHLRHSSCSSARRFAWRRARHSDFPILHCSRKHPRVRSGRRNSKTWL